MDFRKLLAYSVSAGLVAFGIYLMFAEDDAPTHTGPAVQELRPLAGPGYNGRGSAQVQFDGQFESAEPERTRSEPSAEQLARQRAAEARGEDLRKVLQNLQGEPVYVQGVDDARPEDD